MTRSEIEKVVKSSIKDLRPYLERDGGDISFVEIDEELTVWVELHGSCTSCSMSQMTMKAGLEEAIRAAAPRIKSVRAINAMI